MMNQQKITVFGASGKIGSELLTRLSEAGLASIAVTRNIERAIAKPHITWVQADMADKNSLYAALNESNRVFLLSGSSPDFVAEQNNVIDVARELGIAHVVKLSSGAADSQSPLFIPRTHGEVEDHLMQSGMHWTMLRPNGIMQNWLGVMAQSIKTHRMFNESTGEGKRAHVDRRDIAEVAFQCLTDPQKHAEQVYLLTSDKAVSYFEIAAAISTAIGAEVRYAPISLEQARQAMTKEGMPFALVETFLSYDQAQLEGKADVVTNHVRTILGRPARTLASFVEDYVDDFR